jgi:hypothetical protein
MFLAKKYFCLLLTDCGRRDIIHQAQKGNGGTWASLSKIFSPLVAGTVKAIFALRSCFVAHRSSHIVLPVLAWARNWKIGQYRHPVLFLSPGAGSDQS